MPECAVTAIAPAANATATFCLKTNFVTAPTESPTRTWAATWDNRLGRAAASRGSLTAIDSITTRRQLQERKLDSLSAIEDPRFHEPTHPLKGRETQVFVGSNPTPPHLRGTF